MFGCSKQFIYCKFYEKGYQVRKDSVAINVFYRNSDFEPDPHFQSKLDSFQRMGYTLVSSGHVYLCEGCNAKQYEIARSQNAYCITD